MQVKLRVMVRIAIFGDGVQHVQVKDNAAVGAAPNEPEWAGNLVVHRLIQHADGSLTLGEVKGN